MLLLIDDAPNCNPNLVCENVDGVCPNDAATVAQIEALASIGVGTVVVGLPGSELYADSLQEFARVGNAPNQSLQEPATASAAQGQNYSGVCGRRR